MNNLLAESLFAIKRVLRRLSESSSVEILKPIRIQSNEIY